MNDQDLRQSGRQRLIEYLLTCGVVSAVVLTCMHIVARDVVSTLASISESIRSVI